jgi:NAD(P)-dependent dehydrogenase (short-subunit alcohol dehydrogenase family)
VRPEDLMQNFAIICAAPVMLSQAFAAQNPGGGDPDSGRDRAIINILDQRLAHPHGDQLSYTLAKQALAGFTQIAARTLAPDVRVNAVAPGLTIATPDYAPEDMERLAAMMPLARLPQPEQVAQAVLYLAQASAVTGQVLTVDGGAHMVSYPRDFMHL